jgi:hypothetical protein
VNYEDGKIWLNRGDLKKTLKMNALGENGRHLIIPLVLRTQRHIVNGLL